MAQKTPLHTWFGFVKKHQIFILRELVIPLITTTYFWFFIDTVGMGGGHTYQVLCLFISFKHFDDKKVLE